MPSTITHTHISLDTLKRVNLKPKELISKHLEDYKSFAQGMDILYFYHILLIKSNIVQKLGHDFHHEKTNEVFKYIIEYNKENKSDIIFTFLSGLITHYVADSTIHPYVNYIAKSKTKLEQTDRHFEVETYLDNYMISKKHKDYKTFKNYKLQFNNKKNQKIIKLIDNIYQEFFNYPNMGKKYYQALKEMRFVFKYIRHDKTGIKRKIFQLIDFNKFKIRRVTYLSYHFELKNFDHYLNTTNKKWFNIRNESITSNNSFEELYIDTCKKASNIINKLYEYIYQDKKIDLDKLLENRSYSTGLPIK